MVRFFNCQHVVGLLLVEILQQRLIIRFAQVGAHAHVQGDGSGNAGRESLGRIVTAGAVLTEDLFAALRIDIGRVPLRMLRSGRGRIRAGLAEGNARGQRQATQCNLSGVRDLRQVLHRLTLAPVHVEGVTKQSGVCHRIVDGLHDRES